MVLFLSTCMYAVVYSRQVDSSSCCVCSSNVRSNMDLVNQLYLAKILSECITNNDFTAPLKYKL